MARVSADQRREQLVAAAYRVMAKMGVPATTTRLIAEEAGVPQSVFHYCFRSKDELFRELLKEALGEMTRAALDAFVGGENFEESTRKSLLRMFHAGAEMPDKQLAFYELTTAALREPANAGLATYQYEEYFRNTADFLNCLAERGGVQWTVPMDALSRLAVSVIDGLILGWLTDRNSAMAEATLTIFAKQLVAVSTAKS